MGTRMLLFPGEEHLHRAPSWGGIHDPDAGNPSSWMAPACYSPTSTSGGNTWSKRLAASSNTHNNNNNDSDSWEVRAFAEDASTSGQWPPRSYSCSFCQREFRTAQALGGHMNVHRRERAQANQLAQLRTTTGTDAHNNGTTTTPTSSHDDNNNNNRIPNHNANHWLTRSNSQDIDACNSRAYAPTRSVVGDDDCYPASYGGPSSYRNPSSYESRYESAWRSPYDAPRDCGLDLELRLGQRYD